MYATKSESRPVLRDGERIRDSDALVGVRSTDELHTCAIAQIDSGNHLHSIRSSINALRNTRPVPELFSG